MSEAPGNYPVGTIAKLLLLTDRRVQQLSKAGHLPKAERGLYPLVGAVQGYIRFLQDDARRKTAAVADNDLRRAKVREIERRMAREDKRLVDLSEAIGLVDHVIGQLRSEFDGVSARLTRDLTMRAIIEHEIDAILRRAAARLDQAADAVKTGGVFAGAGPEDDSGSVGEGES